jgi:hypothetical protein
MILKLFFKYECIWSVFDKVVINQKYTLGSDPTNHPFRFIYGKYDPMILVGIIVVINCIIIFFRNNSNLIVKYLALIDIPLFILVEYNVRLQNNQN